MNNPHDAEWLRAQLEEFVKDYTQLAETDMTTRDDHASGRGFGYEQCTGIVRAILGGIPYSEFTWDDKYNAVPRPVQYRDGS